MKAVARVKVAAALKAKATVKARAIAVAATALVRAIVGAVKAKAGQNLLRTMIAIFSQC